MSKKLSTAAGCRASVQTNCKYLSGPEPVSVCLFVQKSSELLVDVVVNGNCFSMILDSGSYYSLIQPDFVRGMSLQPCEVRLIDAQGCDIKVFGQIKLKFALGNLQFEAMFIVANISCAGLLGSMFLRENACEIRFGTGEMLVRGRRVLLRAGASASADVHSGNRDVVAVVGSTIGQELRGSSVCVEDVSAAAVSVDVSCVVKPTVTRVDSADCDVDNALGLETVIVDNGSFPWLIRAYDDVLEPQCDNPSWDVEPRVIIRAELPPLVENTAPTNPPCVIPSAQPLPSSRPVLRSSQSPEQPLLSSDVRSAGVHRVCKALLIRRGAPLWIS